MINLEEKAYFSQTLDLIKTDLDPNKYLKKIHDIINEIDFEALDFKAPRNPLYQRVKIVILKKLDNGHLIHFEEPYEDSKMTIWKCIGVIQNSKLSGKGFVEINFLIDYKGDFKDGRFDGQGTLKDLEGTYQGEFLNGKKHGQGTYVYKRGDQYKGAWKEDLPDGQGKFSNAHGTYEGEFRAGKPNGEGIVTDVDGKQYIGKWLDGELQNPIKIIFINGDIYDGDQVYWKREGKGKSVNAQGATYEGDWLNDHFHGYGTRCYPDGSIYKGGWKEGKIEGYGELTTSTGESYIGTWKNAERDCGKGVELNWKDNQFYNVTYQHGKVTEMMKITERKKIFKKDRSDKNVDPRPIISERDLKQLERELLEHETSPKTINVKAKTKPPASTSKAKPKKKTPSPTEKPPVTDDNACSICFMNKKNIVFIPCGHLNTCGSCENKVATCPICRADKVNFLAIQEKGLGQKDKCMVCLEEEVDTALAPCGHYAFCNACVKTHDDCPICKKTSTAAIKVFSS